MPLVVLEFAPLNNQLLLAIMLYIYLPDFHSIEIILDIVMYMSKFVRRQPLQTTMMENSDVISLARTDYFRQVF